MYAREIEMSNVHVLPPFRSVLRLEEVSHYSLFFRLFYLMFSSYVFVDLSVRRRPTCVYVQWI
jgi:hypothetical protein